MALTGLCWSFEWYRGGLGAVLGTEVGGKSPAEELIAPEAAPLTYAALLDTANKALPYPGNYRITPPQEEAATLSLTKYKTGFFAGPSSDKIVLNRFTGKVLALERFADKPLNQQIAASIKPSHAGEIFGTFSKILYFIACLIGTSLPVTGVIIWINNLRKKSGKRDKAQLTVAG